MFGTKMFPGVGYPTPVSIPDETTCLIIQVPASDEWWALMVGLLYELTLEWNWQQFEGGLDRDVAAAKWQEVFDQAINLASVSDACSLTVGTPFWDENSADDADDEAPINDQEWYGEIETVASFTIGSDELTFVENAFIFVVAGLIAYTGQIGGAIAFVPIAQKFVIKAKTNPLGGFIAFLRDGVEIGRTDTYSAEDGTVDTTIVWPTTEGFVEDDAPILWVMLTDQVNPAVEGEPSMTIIRDQLSASQVTPPNIRWNEDCNCVQQTPDNGTTWVDTPQNDPRHGDGFRIPPRGGDDPKCDAAENMKAHIKATFDAIIGSTNALQAASAVFGVFSLFFFEFGIIIDLILAVVNAIFSVGTATLDGALTDDVYDQLLCILYCNISSDGTVTSDQFDTIYAAIDTAPAPMAGTASTVMKLLLDTWGEVELSNAGARGEETGDCEACECCPSGTDWCETLIDRAINDDGGYVADTSDPVWGSFTPAPGAFINDTESPPPDNYAWVTAAVSRSVGIEKAHVMIISRTLPSGTYTDITFDWGIDFGTFTTDIRECTVKIDGTDIVNVSTSQTGSAHWIGSITGTPVMTLRFVASYRNDSTDGGGGGYFTSLIVGGTGTKPIF